MEPSIAHGEEYLTDAQFCMLLSVTPRTSNEWRRNNTGPAYVRIGPRRILYRRTDVEAWLASRTYRHRAHEMVTKAA